MLEIKLEFIEEAIALLEKQVKEDYKDAFNYGRLQEAKSLYLKLLEIKDLREKLGLIIT